MPKRMPAAWKAQAFSDKDHFVLSVRTGSTKIKPIFFPLDADQIDNSAPQTVTPSPDGVRLTLKKSDQLVKTPATIRGVLEFGSGEAYEVSAPVQPLRIN